MTFRALLLAAPFAIPLAVAYAAPASAAVSATAHLSFSGAYGSFLDGRFALASGDPAHAAESLLRANAADPGAHAILEEAFVASLLAGRPEAQRLARLLPDDPAARLLLAGADLAAGRAEAAEQRFRGLRREGLFQVLGPITTAWSQMAGGHPDRALAGLRPLVDARRFRAVYALQAAFIADIANRREDAAHFYAVAKSELPQPNLRFALALASWQARTGHQVEAEASLRELADGVDDVALSFPALVKSIAVRPVNTPSEGVAEAYFTLAAALQGEDQPQFPAVLLRLALELRPNFATARLLAADLETRLHHYPAAREALAPVQPDDPLSASVILRRADIAERAGDTETALTDLRGLATAYPASPIPELQLAETLRLRERYADAVPVYDRAIANISAPVRSAWPAFFGRGIALERSGQWDRAEADFRRALDLSPDQPGVLNYLGYSWADQGTHLEEARAMLERAVELRPNDAAIADSLGWVTLRMGRTAEAVRLLERAAESQPEDPAINFHLGDAYAAAGRKREAVIQWRRALLFKPDPSDREKINDRLRAAGEEQADSTPPADQDKDAR